MTHWKPDGATQQPFPGAYPALVVALDDPEGLGRVRVRFPWSADDGAGYEAWARTAVPFAGANRGAWWIPDVDDEVLVVFAFGDPSQPCVVGSLWNGQDAPPEEMDSSQNNDLKVIASRTGVKITIDDASGGSRLKLETPAGQSIHIDDESQSVEVRDASGNVVKLDSSGVTVTASAQVKVEAGTVEVNAGMVTVNAGMSKFSGVVQADTVIANSVISTSYTPGAGNIW